MSHHQKDQLCHESILKVQTSCFLPRIWVETTSKFVMLQMTMLVPDKAFILRVDQSCGFFFIFVRLPVISVDIMYV